MNIIGGDLEQNVFFNFTDKITIKKLLFWVLGSTSNQFRKCMKNIHSCGWPLFSTNSSCYLQCCIVVVFNINNFVAGQIYLNQLSSLLLYNCLCYSYNNCVLIVCHICGLYPIIPLIIPTCPRCFYHASSHNV